MRHKHADTIIAWANGAVVQDYNPSIDMWETVSCPLWLYRVKYRASLAIVEGKPVFAGDVLYLKDTGKPYTIRNNDSTGDLMWNAYSWNPPKPATITVTIPRPYEVLNHLEIKLHFDSAEKHEEAYKAINRAMK